MIQLCMSHYYGISENYLVGAFVKYYNTTQTQIVNKSESYLHILLLLAHTSTFVYQTTLITTVSYAT